MSNTKSMPHTNSNTYIQCPSAVGWIQMQMQMQMASRSRDMAIFTFHIITIYSLQIDIILSNCKHSNSFIPRSDESLSAPLEIWNYLEVLFYRSIMLCSTQRRAKFIYEFICVKSAATFQLYYAFISVLPLFIQLLKDTGSCCSYLFAFVRCALGIYVAWVNRFRSHFHCIRNPRMAVFAQTDLFDELYDTTVKATHAAHTLTKERKTSNILRWCEPFVCSDWNANASNVVHWTTQNSLAHIGCVEVCNPYGRLTD